MGNLFLIARTEFKFRGCVAWATGLWLLVSIAAAGAQSPAKVPEPAAQVEPDAPTGTPQSWAEGAVRNEMQVIESAEKVPLRYRQRKVGAKGDTTREVLVSREGNVARLV